MPRYSLHKPPKIVTQSFGFSATRERLLPMESADQHNEIELNFIERGEMVFRRGTDITTLTTGGCILYWAAVPHQVLAVEPKTEFSWFALPLSWFLSWKLPEEFSHRLLHGEMFFLENLSDDLRLPSFGNWARDFRSGSPELQLAVKLEMEAFFHRLAFHFSRTSNTPAQLSSASEEYLCAHVEKMVRYITEHYREDVCMDDIVKATGLNAEYAMRLFRKRWGVTLWTFLLQQRISEARRLLLLSDATLADIAFDCGFQSLSRFYHVFKQQCNCSPGAYRKQHIGEAAH